MIEIQTLFKVTPIQKVIPWVLQHSVPDYITTDCIGNPNYMILKYLCWQPATPRNSQQIRLCAE